MDFSAHPADPNTRRIDLGELHPAMRHAVVYLLNKFESDQLPFRVFEAYRSPRRQAWLYEQGRTRPGAKVTDAQAWSSYHQFGLAVDFVLWVNNQWSWNTSGVYQMYWKRLKTLGLEVGLEPLSWELPHLQVAGLTLSELQKGQFPSDGDDSWRDNLEASIIGWTGKPAAPPITSLRPPMPGV